MLNTRGEHRGAILSDFVVIKQQLRQETLVSHAMGKCRDTLFRYLSVAQGDDTQCLDFRKTLSNLDEAFVADWVVIYV